MHHSKKLWTQNKSLKKYLEWPKNSFFSFDLKNIIKIQETTHFTLANQLFKRVIKIRFTLTNNFSYNQSRKHNYNYVNLIKYAVPVFQ